MGEYDDNKDEHRLIWDDEEENIPKSSVELVKYLPDILKNGRFTSFNITINDIKGDNYSGNAVNNGAGHDNVFNSGVSKKVNTKEKANLNISDYNKVYEYLEKQRNNPYCSFLIVLAIFNKREYELVYNEAKILYEMIVSESTEKIDKNGKRSIVSREPFEITRQRATRTFGVEFYGDMLITNTGRIKTDFIRFGLDEHPLMVLRCIYSEFASLRDNVSDYLIMLIFSEKVSLYVAAIETLKNLCDINPEYFISKIVARLVRNKSVPSDIAIAQVLCTIANNSESNYRAEKYLDAVPSIEKDIHYYIITLMMCKPLSYERHKIGKLLRPVLWELVNQPRLQSLLEKMKIDLPDEDDFINNIDLFFNIGNRYSEYYMALVDEMSSILKRFKRGSNLRIVACYVFLLFVQEDYNESCLGTSDSVKFKDMVFIRLVLRDKETSDNLIYLWSELLRKFKKRTENILEGYLRKRDGHVGDDTEYLKIETFFRRLSYVEKSHNNLLHFLKNISSRPKNPIPLAGRIYIRIGG